MITKIRIAAVAAVLACSAYSSAAAAAKVCDKGFLTGSGYHNNKGQARSQAKSDWESKAYAIAPAYSSWSRARNRSDTCMSEGKFPNRRWSCAAKAEPCRKA